MPSEEREVVDRLTRWADGLEAVRALLLVGSRGRPAAALDRFSDYDVILVVDDATSFASDDSWLRAYGTPLVMLRTTHSPLGAELPTRLVLYDDGTKIDYLIWPVELLRAIPREGLAVATLDLGYRVLVDKDQLAPDLPPPTHQAHIPPKPTETEFRALVEEFWWETTYVAKDLSRGELFPAKYSFDAVIKFDLLRRMLEWYAETERGWSLRPGRRGRRLRTLLPPDLWAEVERTFVGADVNANWEALFATTALFRRIATAVARGLRYRYPVDLDRRVSDHLSEVRATAADR